MSRDAVQKHTTGHTHMKHQQGIRRLSLIRVWIRGGAPPGTPGRGLDAVIDRLERVMPDLPQIGVGMLIVTACASCGWIAPGVDDITRQALESAQDVAALEVPGSVAP